MNIIAHRRNQIEELQQTPTRYGVEVDIRSLGPELIIHHDAFVQGVAFAEWIRHYRHGTLILNVKEEGLESRLIELMAQHRIEDYFFLDQSFPFLVKWSRTGFRKSAVRVSEYESVHTAMSLAGQVDWVWVDCFTRFPLSKSEATQLQEAGFRLCLVSPELQGRTSADDIPQLMDLLRDLDIRPDAVCTKRPEVWESFA